MNFKVQHTHELLKSFCTAVFLSFACTVSAQIDVTELNLDHSVAEWFDGQIGRGNAPFLQGEYYPIKNQTYTQHQFFTSLSWQKGTVVSEGHLYKGVQLLYNTVQDELITLNLATGSSGTHSIKLEKWKINGFLVHNKTFEHLRGPVVPSNGPGYYELLYNGSNLRMYTKHIKTSKLSAGSEVFDISTKHYLFVENQFHLYKGKKTLIALFPNLKNEIKLYAKKNHTAGNRREDASLIQLLQLCDRLMSQNL